MTPTPRWLHPLLLAVPFLAGIAVLRGLTVEIDTFHGSDARVYHLPTILKFADELPGVGLERYPAAQTPLFHLLFALYGKLAGFELWKLRLLNVGISYLAVLILYRLLARAAALEPAQALALALLFALSPYFFGASFTLLTDNLALLFGLLALERLHRFGRQPSLGTFGLGCLALAAAVLTRQSFLWLAPVAVYYLLRSPWPLRGKAAAAGMAALSLAPFAALVVLWGGLVPPSADPASCGLCTSRPGVGEDALTLRTVGFTVAIAGLYAAALYAPIVLRWARALRSSLPRVVLPLVAGGALVAVSPLAYKPITPGVAGDAGYLWKVSDEAPVVASSSVLFWVLVPVGALALYALVRRAGVGSLPAVYLASFVAAALPVRLVYQKYFDPFVLLALALLVRPSDLASAPDYSGIALLGAAFVAYAVSFAV